MIVVQISENKIPVNLITGFLGAGKTTALQSLLKQRPANERWAILVNEYGMVSLDHILLNDSDDENGSSEENGVHVDELAGGCFCCSLSMALPLAIARMIRKTRPHRILLEPTGSGHPASVIDLLRTGRLSEVLQLKTTICLVDPRDYLNPRITNSEVFQDQIQMADVVAINFTDKCSVEQIRECRKFAESQDPPKLIIAETSFGELQVEWLDLDDLIIRPPFFPEAHQHAAVPAQAADGSVAESSMVVQGPDLQSPFSSTIALPSRPIGGKPVRFENEGLNQIACGWIFAADDVFRRNDLWDFLGSLQSVLRLKGVFHCEDDWWSIQRRGRDTSVRRTAYRRDSRIEIIAEAKNLDWNLIEQQLQQCLLSMKAS